MPTEYIREQIKQNDGTYKVRHRETHARVVLFDKNGNGDSNIQDQIEGINVDISQLKLDNKKLYFGARLSYPATGDAKTLYIDSTVNPPLMYTWNTVLEDYVITGGTGGSGGGSGSTTGYDEVLQLPSTGWTGDVSPYTQTVTAKDMSSSKAVVYAQVTEQPIPSDEEMSAYDLICGILQETGQVTFYAYEKPEIDLTVRAFCGAGAASTNPSSVVFEIEGTLGEDD